MKYSILILLCFSIFSLADSVKIMPLGDSITYDDSYKDVDNPRPASLRHGYRNHLWYLLHNEGYAVNFVGSRSAGSAITPPFDPDNEGYPGATSYDIAEIVYDRLQKNSPDIILLYIGANDWDEDISGVNKILDTIDHYEQQYTHHIKVILARIANRRHYYEWMSHFNQNLQVLANRRISNGDDIYVVDMEYGAGIDYSEDFQDPTHPNDTGYQKIANVWFNALIGFLPPPSKYDIIDLYTSSVLPALSGQ